MGGIQKLFRLPHGSRTRGQPPSFSPNLKGGIALPEESLSWQSLLQKATREEEEERDLYMRKITLLCMEHNKQYIKPLLIQLQANDGYQALFQPPQTHGFHSGRPVLRSGESVGEHSTEGYEEVLIILEGEGEVNFEAGHSMHISEGSIVYIPPYTLHNVTNTGKSLLKYIYIAAPAEQASGNP